MALERFKTQVLLLHSEQSTLDSLSSGIDSRYTVHCATSGTEALNTLGETPIHVIISAQDLPGMSGVEALREAKKRSPDTIGILLAGKNDKGLEALVGEKEVFQVVRGGISAEELGRLVDNATRQMRLLALAESANDTAANPDEPVSEHIIMETSENGSTIISDGTGQVPVLDPQKISAAQAAGANAVDVLVLTKDEEFLATVKESSRGMHNVRHANTLAQAEAAITNHRIGVAVVDAAMVGPNVEKLTQHLRRKTARLVNIVAGRRDDGEMLMDLINRGKVYRFLLKPVSPGRARLAIEASVKHHLEAPESAFRVTGQPAAAQTDATPQPKAVPKPAAKAVPKPAPKAAAKPSPQPAAGPKPASPAAGAAAAAKAAPERAPEQNPEPMHISIDDGLSSAFDDDDPSFTETMTGIVARVGRSFSRTEKPGIDALPSAPVRDAASTRKIDADNMATALSIDSGNDGGSMLANPKMLGFGAVAVAAIAAAAYFMFAGTGDELPDAEPPAVAEQRGKVGEQEIGTTDAGGPAAVPNAEIVADTIAAAESALLERRIADADAALASVTAIDPDNPRLPFLTAQLKQLQLRDHLDEARNAIRSERFEDAATALRAAEALDIDDASSIATVTDELRAARSAQRVEDVLAEAAARLEDGALIAPANDNARYFYELVLSTDPDNTAAQQGLSIIAGKLVLAARAEIDRGSFGQAESLLSEARRLDADSPELAASTRALSGARARADEQRQRREAEQRAEAERLAALQRAEDERRAAAARAAAAERQAAQQPAAEDADAEAEVEEPATETLAAVTPPASAAAADEPTLAEEFRGPNQAPGSVAEPVRPVEESPIAISSLTRTKYVAPRYPRAAERRSISGWVDVVFTVAADGSTRDIDIRDSEPGDTFVNAAVRAVEDWEFEPVIENGEIVEKRAGVRMMFAIE